MIELNNIIKIIFISFIFIFVLLSIFIPCNLKFKGRPIWPCPNNNRFKNIYINNASGEYTSQSLFDPYSFTHISHGILLHNFFNYISNNLKFNLFISFFIEILWEIIENSDYVINIYRSENSNSRDYSGDSIINSLGDIFSMFIGYIISNFLFEKFNKSNKFSIILFIINEILLTLWIKDSLIKNIYQIFIKKR